MKIVFTVNLSYKIRRQYGIPGYLIAGCIDGLLFLLVLTIWQLVRAKNIKQSKYSHLHKNMLCQSYEVWIFAYLKIICTASVFLCCSNRWKYYTHCKKSWRNSSTPAPGDAGPIHTGIEKSFRHPWRKFYYKYRTFSTEFFKCRTSSAEMDCLKSNITSWARIYVFRFTFQYSTTAPHFLPYWSARSVS
jgi:hypothetical protein